MDWRRSRRTSGGRVACVGTTVDCVGLSCPLRLPSSGPPEPSTLSTTTASLLAVALYSLSSNLSPRRRSSWAAPGRHAGVAYKNERFPPEDFLPTIPHSLCPALSSPYLSTGRRLDHLLP